MATRSENMRRLWSDPEWRGRQIASASARMAALNAKRWSDPAEHAAQRERTRRQMLAVSTARIEAAQLHDRAPRETSGAPHDER